MKNKIIHFIAPESQNKWHPLWFKCLDSWKENFKTFEIKMWNDSSDLDNLIKNDYPDFYEFYNDVPFHIMRLDIARLFILHKYGGIYADMDYYCYKNFENILQGDFIVVENISSEYTEFTNAAFENNLIYSSKNNKFILQIIYNMKYHFYKNRESFDTDSSNWRSDKNSGLVNCTTGSAMLSACINQLLDKFPVSVFSGYYFNNRPMSYKESYYCKHAHTGIWGNDYISDNYNEKKLLIYKGISYIIDVSYYPHLHNKDDRYDLLDFKDFSFKKDYTEDTILLPHNKEKVNEYISIAKKELKNIINDRENNTSDWTYA